MTETTEKIVESYFRYCRDCATMTNIKCSAQHEIDLLAVDLRTGTRYHVESSVCLPGSGFSKLTNGAFDSQQMKDPNKKPTLQRTMGFFMEHKFAADGIAQTLATYGFAPGNYHKVIVTWDCEPAARETAKENGIEVWEFPDLVDEIVAMVGHGKQYVMDDTIRTLQLLVCAQRRNNA